MLEGKYRVESVVAEGGFGVVYRGVHLRLKKPVAVKVLKLQHIQSDQQRAAVMAQFELEAETVARLDHPALVRVLDFGISSMPDGAEAPWMAFDWMEGITLAKDLRARRGEPGRSPKEVLTMLRPALSALAKAHSLGIAHRDVKPGNLMLSPRREGADWDTDEVPVKILDFGIAKEMPADEQALASGETVTKSAFAAFSLRYAAPEQITGTRTGPWTDVYQMATVITELLTNRSPYQGGDAMDVHMQIMAPSRLTPARHGVDVGTWEPVLAKALAIKPAERYANAKELLDALTAQLPAETRASPARSEAVAPAGSVDLVAERSSHTLRPSTTRVGMEPRSAKVGTLIAVACAALVGGGLLARSLRRAEAPRAALAEAPEVATVAAVTESAPELAAPPPSSPPVVEAPRDAGAPATAAAVPAAPDAGTARRVRPRERPRPTVLVAPVRVD